MDVIKIPVAIVFLITVIYLIYTFNANANYSRNTILEKFSIEHFDNNKSKSNKNTFDKLSKEDSKLYEEIIHIYFEVLDRFPIPLELMTFFDKIKSGVLDLDELKDQLTDEIREIQRLNITTNKISIDERKEKKKGEKKKGKKFFNSNNEYNKNVNKIMNEVKEENKNKEKKNVNKEKDKKTQNGYDLDIDEDRIIKIKKSGDYTTQFNDNEEFIKTYMQEVGKDDKKNKTLILSNPKIYNTYNTYQTPSTLEKTTLLENPYESEVVTGDDGLIKDKCASILNNSTALSKLQEERNKNELDFKCAISTDVLEKDKKMVLREDQKWTIPQDNRLACNIKDGDKCDVVRLPTDTTLVGTFLK